MRLLLFLVVALVVTTGCGKLLRGLSGGDDTPDAPSATAATASAAPSASAPAYANVADVKRYPDETPPDTTPTAILTHDGMRVRAEVPNGTVVATLKNGQLVSTLAEHGGFVLVSFPDPKDAASTLLGWIAKGGFSAIAHAAEKTDTTDHVAGCGGNDFAGPPLNRCVGQCFSEKDCSRPCLDDWVVKDCGECTADQKCISAQHVMEDGVGWNKACIGRGNGCPSPTSTGFDPTAPRGTTCGAGQALVMGGASGHMPVCMKKCNTDADCAGGVSCVGKGDPSGDVLVKVCNDASGSLPH